MTDTTQAVDEGTVFNVPITKGGKAAAIAVSTSVIPDDVYNEIFLQGLKTLMNRGMSKITKETYPDEAERQAAAMKKAAENLEAIKTSKIRFTGGKKKQATGAIMTEARRLARNVIKDEIKRQGEKVSHYKASAITEAANAYLETDEGLKLITKAKETIEARQKEKSEGAASIVSSIKVSPELVAKAEEKKAKAKAAGLSAKQAGKVQLRAKPEARA